MLSIDEITTYFCLIDDFCKELEKNKQSHVLEEKTNKKRRNRTCRLSDSEVITIMIIFHHRQYRNLKHFYINHVQVYLQKEFPETVSYNRFVELQKKAMLSMALFLKMCCLGSCTGISFIDATLLKVCHIKRQYSHKTFKNVAAKGKSTMGWFFGFKLHIIINDTGEIIEFMLTPGNTDDRKPLNITKFYQKIFRNLIGDKGYISQKLFEKLFSKGIRLITNIKKNMKNSLRHISERILLRKRALVETVYDQLKNICQIEYSRHHSFENFLTNLFSGLIAYSFLPKKQSLNLNIKDNDVFTCVA